MALPINPETITCVVTKVSNAVENEAQYGALKVVCFEAEGLDSVRFDYANPGTDIPNRIGLHRYGAVIVPYDAGENAVESVTIKATYHGHEYTGSVPVNGASVGTEFTLSEAEAGGGGSAGDTGDTT